MMLHLWMTVTTGSDQLRLPADWIESELGPVEVPTPAGLVDLRSLAREANGESRVSVLVDDGENPQFTVTFARH
jgi:hypothetical protein